MNFQIIVIAAVAPLAAFAAQSAKAQEAKAFSGKCTEYAATKEACEATQWCHYVTRKAVTLPDGKTFTPKPYCAFRSGMKQAWNATQGQ